MRVASFFVLRVNNTTFPRYYTTCISPQCYKNCTISVATGSLRLPILHNALTMTYLSEELLSASDHSSGMYFGTLYLQERQDQNWPCTRRTWLETYERRTSERHATDSVQFAEDYHALGHGHGSIQKPSGDQSLNTVGDCHKINSLVTFSISCNTSELLWRMNFDLVRQCFDVDLQFP